MIKYQEGDLFPVVGTEPSSVVIPHVCNNQGGWGSGFVVPLGRNYPIAQNCYHMWHEGRYFNDSPYCRFPDYEDMVRISGKFGLGQTQIVQASAPDLFVANMVAQILGGSRPLFYNHLVKCMEYVGKFAKEQNAKIMCPMFGSALAGGDWKFIEQLIED